MIRNLFLFCLFTFLSYWSISQNKNTFYKVPYKALKSDPDWIQELYSENPNLYLLADLYSSYYKKYPFKKNIHTQNYKYWLRTTREFIGEGGYLIDANSEEYKNKIAALKKQKTNSSKTTGDWISAGPFETYENNGSLETRPTQVNIYAIAVAPSDSTILYCLSESGGVFKTIDHGMNWDLVSLNENFTNGQDLKVHPNDPNIVYLAVNADILKTIDGGDTWETIYLASGQIEQFYIHRTEPEKVFAATDNMLLYTNNDGETWTNIFSERCWDIEAHATDPNTLFLSVHSNTGQRSEIYKSTDNGANWELKDNGWYEPENLSQADDFGCKIGVTPADPNRIYAGLIGNSKNGDNGWIGIYYSDDAGETWVNSDGIDGGPYDSGNDMNTNWYVAGYSDGYHQGWYNFDLDVSHTDPDKLWVGTIWACESGNKGANIEYIRGTRSLSMHADVQDIDVVGNDIWYVSDGGINYSNDEMLSVEIRHYGIHSSDFWGFGQGWNEDTWTGGRYHNGDAVYLDSYNFGNTMFLGGAERSTGYINPLNNRHLYFSDITDVISPDLLSQNSTPTNNISIYPNESYSLLNSSEIEFDPRYAGHLFLGNDKYFYKSTDGGASFVPIYEFNNGSSVLEFEISRSNPEVIYCLVRFGSNGRIYKSEDGGNSFEICSNLPSNDNARLDLTLNPDDENDIWVSTYYGSNGQKVYRSEDGGNLWNNYTTESLDNHNILDILYQHGTDDVVYVATNYGLFYWDSTTEDWISYSSGLPFVTKGLKMAIFYKDSKIRLSSARGIWEASLAVPSVPSAQPQTYFDVIYCSRDTIQFEDHSILDHQNASWEWAFDPEPAYVSSYNIRNPLVVFEDNGSYDVTLTITNGEGTTSTTTLEDMITLDNQCAAEPFPGLAMEVYDFGDYASIPDLNIEQTVAFSVSCWVKPNGIQQEYSGIVFNDDSSAGFNFKSNNELGYHWPGGEWWWNSGLTAEAGEWSHVAMVVTTGSFTIYVNGEASTHNINLDPSDIHTMKIGSYKGWEGRNYKGEIDEVCIWNRSLTQAEIRELRHLTRTGEVSYSEDMVAYYQFNLDGTSVISDRISTNHAQLNSNASKIPSTAPVGGGQSSRLTVEENEEYLFGETGLMADFGNSSPEGEIVVSRLNLLPDSLPNSNPSIPNYWIINNYGSTDFEQMDSLLLTTNTGSAYGVPEDALLYIREENGHLNDWEMICQATYLDAMGYHYSSDCAITNTSQFFIQSANANEIYTTGLEELNNANNWSLYPNPSEGDINLSFNNSESDITVSVYTITGQVIHTSRYSNIRNLNLNLDLAAGTYLVDVQNNIGAKKVFRLIMD